MFCNQFPVFLGVRYDRLLPFTEYVQKLCQCPAVSTSSVLKESRHGDGTLQTIVGSSSQLCIECLNMQMQPGHLGCQLPPPTNLRKSSWKRPEPSPALFALPHLKQSSRYPSCSLFSHVQTISILKADEWAHLPPADNHRQTLFTACRQRLKRKD